MKKLLNISFIYAIAGIAAGAVYREFSKFVGFSGRTSMAYVHTHLLVLGMIFFLICSLFAMKLPLFENKKFNIFMKIYNVCLPIIAGVMFLRGTLQLLDITLSKTIDASISGVSGLTHIMFTISIILYFLALKETSAEIE